MRSWQGNIASVFPPEEMTAGGHETVKVASQFGVIHLPRQVLHNQHHGSHVMPGNAALPAHLKEPDLAALKPRLVPHEAQCRRAAWPEELNAVVEAALADEEPVPPEEVSQADWEQVLAARREEADLSTEALRCLGPELAEDQVLVTADEVLTRWPEKRRFWQLRTARVALTEPLVVELNHRLGRMNSVTFRIEGPRSGGNNLCLWDFGYGVGGLRMSPVLSLLCSGNSASSPAPTLAPTAHVP